MGVKLHFNTHFHVWCICIVNDKFGLYIDVAMCGVPLTRFKFTRMCMKVGVQFRWILKVFSPSFGNESTSAQSKWNIDHIKRKLGGVRTHQCYNPRPNTISKPIKTYQTYQTQPDKYRFIYTPQTPFKKIPFTLTGKTHFKKRWISLEPMLAFWCACSTSEFTPMHALAQKRGESYKYKIGILPSLHLHCKNC